MSDPRIASSSASFPQPVTDHHPIETPKAGPVCSIEQNRVEQAERQYATSTMSPFESTISEAASHLGPHQSFEVSCKALVTAELAGKVEGKISIERRDDGKFEVEAFAGGQVGAGVPNGARGMAGVAGGTKFVVETPEAAADLAQAIATTGVVAYAATTPGLWPLAFPLDKITGTSAHATERLDHYRANLVEVSGEGRASGGFSFNLHPAPGLHGHAGAEFQNAAAVKVDLERGELTAAYKVDVGGELKASLDLGKSALGKSAAMLFEGEIEGKMQGRIEARKHVPPAMAEKLKRGDLSPAEASDALKNAKTQWVFVAEVEVEKSLTGLGANGVGKAKVTTEIPLSGDALAKQILSGDQAALLRPLIDAEWEVEAEIGAGGRVGAKSGNELVAAEASALFFTKAKSSKGSLAHCLHHADGQMNDHVTMQQSIDAQRRQ